MEENKSRAVKTVEMLFGNSKDSLIRMATSFLRDEEAAKDVVAEAFIALLGHMDDIATDKYFPYVFTTVRNKCRDIRRADASHSRIVGEVLPFAHGSGKGRQKYIAVSM